MWMYPTAIPWRSGPQFAAKPKLAAIASTNHNAHTAILLELYIFRYREYRATGGWRQSITIGINGSEEADCSYQITNTAAAKASIMGSVTYRDGISILELIVYLPSFFVAAFLVYRHGVRRSGGFAFLVLFTIVRVVGACCEVATIKNPSTGLYTAAAICSSIGLSPLLMTCSGLLSRA
jgi:hypothetical protein